MNAREWLEQATKDMPEAVQKRVQAETLAHLEDAGVGEGADVRAVLGEPKAMRRELGRLYVPERRLRALVEYRCPSFSYFLPCLGLGAVLFGFSFNHNLIHEGLLRQAPLFVSGLWLLALFLTRSLPPVRRRVYHSNLNLVAVQAYVYLSLISSFLRGDLATPWWAAFLILWPFALLHLLWATWHEDRRLHRTLALMGKARA